MAKHPDFASVRDNGGGDGDNQNSKPCKAPLKLGLYRVFASYSLRCYSYLAE